MSNGNNPVSTDVSLAWKKLSRTFATWRVLPLSLNDFWVSLQRFYGNDFLTPSLQLSYWKKAWAVIEDVSDEDLQQLKVFSELNLSQIDNFFRMMLVLYFTVPITGSVVMGELFPGHWQTMGISFEEIAAIFLVYTAMVALLFASYWKAREIDGFVFLALGSRGISGQLGNKAGPSENSVSEL